MVAPGKVRVDEPQTGTCGADVDESTSWAGGEPLRLSTTLQIRISVLLYNQAITLSYDQRRSSTEQKYQLAITVDPPLLRTRRFT